LAKKEIYDSVDSEIQSSEAEDPAESEAVNVEDGGCFERTDRDGDAIRSDTDTVASESASPSVRSEGADSELEQLRKQRDEAAERLLRQAAEFQNYRRRTEQEKAQMVLFGKSIVIQQLLDVFDDFHRSIEAAERVNHEGSQVVNTAYDSLKSGVELAYRKLMDELKKLDVEPIEAEGTRFDERFHEAVMQQPVADGEEEGIIVAEIQRGYRMGERVLRHAKVVVSSRLPEA
jgi:molecular chaperone GrpE